MKFEQTLNDLLGTLDFHDVADVDALIVKRLQELYGEDDLATVIVKYILKRMGHIAVTLNALAKLIDDKR